jgi:hypothetical protein
LGVALHLAPLALAARVEERFPSLIIIVNGLPAEKRVRRVERLDYQ